MASKCVNKVTIIGNLSDDPVLNQTGGGTPVCNFKVVTNETWFDKSSGEKKESKEWHRVVAWRELAKVADTILSKGTLVYIEGKLKTKSWVDKEGKTSFSTEIVAQVINKLHDSRKKEEEYSYTK